MARPTDDILRLGYAEASALMDAARASAREIVSEAERKADLITVEAEAAAAATRNSAAMYLQKARAVLEIAQQRAAAAPPDAVVDLTDPSASVIQLDTDDDATDRENTDDPLAEAVEVAAEARHLPGELDRILEEAVHAAVGRSLRGR